MITLLSIVGTKNTSRTSLRVANTIQQQRCALLLLHTQNQLNILKERSKTSRNMSSLTPHDHDHNSEVADAYLHKRRLGNRGTVGARQAAGSDHAQARTVIIKIYAKTKNKTSGHTQELKTASQSKLKLHRFKGFLTEKKTQQPSNNRQPIRQ